MATRAELLGMLERADAAGDTEAATEFVAMLDGNKFTDAQPIQQTEQPPEEVPQGGGPLSSAFKGLTMGFSDEGGALVGAGYTKAKDLVTGGDSGSFSDNYKAIKGEINRRNDAFRQRNPLLATASEIGGSMLTGGYGASKAGITGQSSLGQIAGAGAIEGGMVGAGNSEADTLGGVALDTAVGAGVGGSTAGIFGAATRGIGKALSPGNVADAAGDKYAASVANLQRNGVPLTTAMQTGGDGFKAVEDNLSRSAFTGGALRKARANAGHKFQGRLMEMAGFAEEDAKKGLVTRDAIEGAKKKFAAEYDKALDGRQIDLSNDGDFLTGLARVEAEGMEFLEDSQVKAVGSVTEKVLNRAAKGPMKGVDYQNMRSSIGKRSRETALNNPRLSNVYSEIQGVLDDAFIRQTGEGHQALNTQYAHFVQLDKAYNSLGGAKVASGELPMATLSRNAKNKRARGSREWKDFIESGAEVFGGQMPNSGTAAYGADMFAAGGSVANPLIGVGYLGGGKAVSNLMANGVGSGIPNMAGGAMQAAGNGLQRAAPAGILAAPAAGGAAQGMLEDLYK